MSKKIYLEICNLLLELTWMEERKKNSILWCTFININLRISRWNWEKVCNFILIGFSKPYPNFKNNRYRNHRNHTPIHINAYIETIFMFSLPVALWHLWLTWSHSSYDDEFDFYPQLKISIHFHLEKSLTAAFARICYLFHVFTSMSVSGSWYLCYFPKFKYYINGLFSIQTSIKLQLQKLQRNMQLNNWLDAIAVVTQAKNQYCSLTDAHTAIPFRLAFLNISRQMLTPNPYK